MSTVEYMFSAFDHLGRPRSTERIIQDAQLNQPQLIFLIESIVHSLEDPSPSSKLVLSVDDAQPVTAQFVPVGSSLGVAAYLTHGQIEAVLVAVTVAASHDRSMLLDLRQKLAEAYPSASLDAPFRWLIHNPPPRAALIYLQDQSPTPGLDTAAMCLSSAFFRLRHDGLG